MYVTHSSESCWPPVCSLSNLSKTENTTMRQTLLLYSLNKSSCSWIIIAQYNSRDKSAARISYRFIRIKIFMFFVLSAYKVQMPITPRPYCKCVLIELFYFTQMLLLTQSDRKTWQLISSQQCTVHLVPSHARGFHAALIGDHTLYLNPYSSVHCLFIQEKKKKRIKINYSLSN